MSFVNFVVKPLSFFLGMWNWDPSILLGLALFLGLYLAAIGPLRSRFKASAPVSRAQATWFILGALFILLALVSPLDELGDAYLFSAHMTQHSLLVFVVPPLLLAGTPGLVGRCPGPSTAGASPRQVLYAADLSLSFIQPGFRRLAFPGFL